MYQNLLPFDRNDNNSNDTNKWQAQDYFVTAGFLAPGLAPGVLQPWQDAVLNDQPARATTVELPPRLVANGTPLSHWLTVCGSSAFIAELSHKLAPEDVDSFVTARNADGQQALHLLRLTPTEKQTAVATQLMNIGANVNASDWSGRTPLDYLTEDDPAYAILIANGAISSGTIDDEHSRGEKFPEF